MKDISQNKKTPKNVRTLDPHPKIGLKRKITKSENKTKSYKMKVVSLLVCMSKPQTFF